EELVAAGQFREDLYYRLAVIPLVAPPLCERQADIGLLIETFIDRFSRRKTDRRTTIDPVAMQSLQVYSWPGNVRELENLMQRLVVLHRGKRITLKELPEKYCCIDLKADESISVESDYAGSSVSSAPPESEWSDDGLDFNGLISEFDDRLILQALSRTGGNTKEAARMLNLMRTTLIEKVQKKNLPV
ncbi:MAG: sigma-54-dependent Fis family transcriptional regulator, partial [Desulfuromusa sp.]|nr:sigma-54-dependent Fis family transcriptional regulator [Desulfuromusa sp.]